MKNLIIIFVLVLATAGTVGAACTDAERKSLEAFDRAWAKAGVTPDRSALTRIYADDFVSMPQMLGKAATIDNTIAAAAGGPSGETLYDRYMFGCTKNTATITHRNIIKDTGADGNMETFWTRSVHFLERNGGSWQVVSSTSHEMDAAIWTWTGTMP